MIRAFDSETDKGRAILLTKPDAWTEPRSFEDCIDFMATDRELGAYNADYDIAAVLSWVPAMVRDRLAELGETTCGLYRIKYVKAKFSKVWYEDELLFTMYDIKQFHNCSLAKACERMGVEQGKLTIPKSWYRKMATVLADPRTRRKVIDYALQDARALQSLIVKTAAKFKAAGLEFTRPASNASFAERRFSKQLKAYTPAKVEWFARKAYFGGRIECLQAGFFRNAWLYDIRSAYPSEIARLVKPDGKWIWDTEIRDDSVYAYIDATVKVSPHAHIGPVATREQTGVLYPVGTFRRVLTLPEYRLLQLPQALGEIKEVHSSVQMIWPKWRYPFEEVKDLYLERAKNPEAEYAIKIILNSLYGKTAQVQTKLVRTNVFNGAAKIVDGRIWTRREEWKDHTSFVYASEITARIRNRLITDIDPGKVVFYATDGVMTTEPVNVDMGKGLGQWSVEKVWNLVVVGSGVYTYMHYDKQTGKPERVTKFRGFNSSLNMPKLLERAGRLHHVPITILRNTSMKQAIGRPKDFNVLKDTRRILDVNFDHKRAWAKRWNARELLTRRFGSESLIRYPDLTMEWLPLYERMDY